MSRTISKIYDEYKIMPQLREHMLRVAATTSLICDSFDESLSKENMIEASLLHDLGNIVKFRLEHFPEFNKPKGLEYWQDIQKEFIEKYGINDHLVTFAIVKELGVKGKTFDLIEFLTTKFMEEGGRLVGFDEKICKYADARIGPNGILSLRDRMTEWKNRDKRISEEHAENTHRIFAEAEKEIFAKCKIKPEDLTDEAINSVISSLKDFVIP